MRNDLWPQSRVWLIGPELARRLNSLSGGSRKGQIKAYLLRHERGQGLETLLGMPTQRQQRAITALSLKSVDMEFGSPKPLRVGLLVMGPQAGAEENTRLLLLWFMVLEKGCLFCSLSFLHLLWATIHWSQGKKDSKGVKNTMGRASLSGYTELGKADILDRVAVKFALLKTVPGNSFAGPTSPFWGCSFRRRIQNARKCYECSQKWPKIRNYVDGVNQTRQGHS